MERDTGETVVNGLEWCCAKNKTQIENKKSSGRTCGARASSGVGRGQGQRLK